MISNVMILNTRGALQIRSKATVLLLKTIGFSSLRAHTVRSLLISFWFSSYLLLCLFVVWTHEVDKRRRNVPQQREWIPACNPRACTRMNENGMHCTADSTQRRRIQLIKITSFKVITTPYALCVGMEQWEDDVGNIGNFYMCTADFHECTDVLLRKSCRSVSFAFQMRTRVLILARSRVYLLTCDINMDTG
jgi:hypothetical protein